MKQKKLEEFLKALWYEDKYYRFDKKQILIEFIEKMV
jgi:hypothetical protein